MINILEGLKYLKDAISEESYSKIVKILEEETNCGFTEEMRKCPGVEAFRYAKLYLPEGKVHYIETVFSDDVLAALIDILFLKDQYLINSTMETEKKEAVIWWYKKEVAYQAVRRLVGKERIPTLIQNEDDWKRYFFFDKSNIKNSEK